MKGIWISAIVVAFTVGTIVTGASVFASDFIFPEPYIRATDGTADERGGEVSLVLGCDEGDTFLSGSSFGDPRQASTALTILENEPQDTTTHTGSIDHVGSIDWHATAINSDTTKKQKLEVHVICLDTNNGDETHDTSESESETDESETDESETNDLLD